jgi:hypothetical protein
LIFNILAAYIGRLEVTMLALFILWSVGEHGEIEGLRGKGIHQVSQKMKGEKREG